MEKCIKRHAQSVKHSRRQGTRAQGNSKLLEFPDRRIKPLVLTLVFSGIRKGAFEGLKWKHNTPIHCQKNNDIMTAKILAYPGDREQYYSFLTPEAFPALKECQHYLLFIGSINSVR
jgi:hypothetical protein